MLISDILIKQRNYYKHLLLKLILSEGTTRSGGWSLVTLKEVMEEDEERMKSVNHYYLYNWTRTPVWTKRIINIIYISK